MSEEEYEKMKAELWCNVMLRKDDPELADMAVSMFEKRFSPLSENKGD